MDFPPIIRLISSTFDALMKKESAQPQKTAAEAPKAVANAPGMGDPETLGVGSGATSGTNRIGSILDTVA
ncbi:hypothetical protein [Pelagicoccus mobilis]|uniref:Uncharacterized protein n=1 Tax=Pelagicoccus mobilis TaxID=415221 RepID=A0A934RXI6_9BACT|nr:hypothetical protein [Pelagicoccus mobilis]MBK1875388.1 hypothetical protein [Pelagicoccus mobilis]